MTQLEAGTYTITNHKQKTLVVIEKEPRYGTTLRSNVHQESQQDNEIVGVLWVIWKLNLSTKFILFSLPQWEVTKDSNDCYQIRHASSGLYASVSAFFTEGEYVSGVESLYLWNIYEVSTNRGHYV